MSTATSITGHHSLARTLVLSAVSVVVAIQAVYALGRVVHAVVLAGKMGGFVSHLVSIGWEGICYYYLLSTALIAGLGWLIRIRGGIKRARWEFLLMVAVMANSTILAVLLAMPFTDIVSRS